MKAVKETTKLFAIFSKYFPGRKMKHGKSIPLSVRDIQKNTKMKTCILCGKGKNQKEGQAYLISMGKSKQNSGNLKFPNVIK